MGKVPGADGKSVGKGGGKKMKWDIYIYIKTGIPIVIDCTQGSNGYEWEFSVKDYTLPPEAEARIYIKKPSGSEIYNDCQVEGNNIKVDVTNQMTAESGKIKAQLQIILKPGTADNVKPFIFWLDVQKNLISDSAIESKDEIGILDSLITEARNAIADTETATEEANTAAGAANTAANKANTAAGTANTAANKANTAADRANTAADEADTAAGAANTAANEANTAADRANQAAEAVESAVSGVINDGTVSNVTTYSSQKMEIYFVKSADTITNSQIDSLES